MTLSKNIFFSILFAILIIPFLFYKITWLIQSEKTNGTMSFVGKSITGQLEHRYAVIVFTAGKDTIWFNGLDNILFKEGEKIPVRYQKKDPADARIDVFASIWGDTLVYGGIPLAMLLIIFLHPQIVPRNSLLELTLKKPFVKIV